MKSLQYLGLFLIIVHICFGDCNPGYFLNATSGLCTICPAGNMCDGINYPVQCLQGQYSPAGASVCRTCPIGMYSSFGSQFCSECLPGTYQNFPGSASCTNCSAGTYTNTKVSAACIGCLPGYYSATVGSATIQNCLPCPIGTYSPRGSSKCLPCPPGTYGLYNTSASCVNCPLGTYNAVAGLRDCFSCPISTYTPKTGSTTCVNCPFNTYSNTTQTINCTKCPNNTFSHYAFTSCLSCQDPDNQPKPGQEHPFFDFTDKNNVKCYFQCPDDFVVNNANHACAELPSSNLGTIIGIVVGVCIGLGLIAAVATWFYCKRKEKERLRQERREKRRKKKEAEAGKIEIKMPDQAPLNQPEQAEKTEEKKQ